MKTQDWNQLGLGALAQAGKKGWFHGHFGAGVLSAEALFHRSDLTDEVKTKIQHQVELLMAQAPELFLPLPEEAAKPELLRTLQEAIATCVTRLELSGHGLIYGTLALRALKARPELLRPAIVEGIVALLQWTHRDRPNRYFGVADFYQTKIEPNDGLVPYQTTQEMILTAFRESQCLFKDGNQGNVFYFFTAEKLHGITHAHAINALWEMGYQDIAKRGLENHLLQMKLNRMEPSNPDEFRALRTDERTPFQVEYWPETHFDDHLLKFTAATLELLDKLAPAARKEVYDPKHFWGPFRRNPE